MAASVSSPNQSSTVRSSNAPSSCSSPPPTKPVPLRFSNCFFLIPFPQKSKTVAPHPLRRSSGNSEPSSSRHHRMLSPLTRTRSLSPPPTTAGLPPTLLRLMTPASGVHRHPRSEPAVEHLEQKSFSKTLLLLLVLMGASMIIGDGILTPSMSGTVARHGLLLVVVFCASRVSSITTGGEAMFADLGHFIVKSIQIAFTFVVFPCLLLAYFGQAAFLMQNQASVDRVFYDSVPGKAKRYLDMRVQMEVKVMFFASIFVPSWPAMLESLD